MINFLQTPLLLEDLDAWIKKRYVNKNFGCFLPQTTSRIAEFVTLGV